MRTVQLYINNKRVDLFQDEKIEISLTTQNIKDIAKVWTDFSQSFTVPCSENNNDIFDYFYENSYDGTYIANDRADARIEINHIPFRKGQIQLEGSTLKDGKPYAYKITFYGDVVTLKDLFGDDKLADLDYSSVNFELTGANVEDRIDGTTDGDVMFPLISSSRVWTYGDAAATDISVAGNAIEYSELFPALSDSLIFSLIESKYGVTFNGNFLSDDRFLKSYTWWKNRETASFVSEPTDITFNLADLSCNADIPSAVGISKINYDYVNPNTLTQPGDWSSWYNGVGSSFHRIQAFINPSTSATYYFDIYKNGVKVQTITGSGASVLPSQGQFAQIIPNQPGLNDEYTFKLRADSSMTFDGTIKYSFIQKYINTSGLLTTAFFECNFSLVSGTVTSFVDFTDSAPDIKVADYFAGMLKMFNLTCYPEGDDLNFTIEPIPDWYDSGQVIDITEYVDLDEIKVDRAKLYNEISFEWEDSKSFMNVAYEGVNNRKWANLKEVFGYDGGDYKIKLPFENLLFQKFTGENLSVGYSLTEAPDYKPYTPKPVKLYKYDSTSCDFYHNDGSTNNNITTYIPFGEVANINTEDYINTFNEEISPLTGVAVQNTLYSVYYQPYLVNLFNPKTRIVTVKCILPLELLTYITLDDALIIRDKQYRINEMKVDLTTGVVRLELISDWITTYKKTLGNPEVIGTAGGTVDIPIAPIKPTKGGKVTVSGDGSLYTTPSETLPYNFTADGILTITVPSNGTSNERTDTYTLTYYLPDGTVYKTEYVEIKQKASVDYLLKEDNGYLLQENLDRIEL